MMLLELMEIHVFANSSGTTKKSWKISDLGLKKLWPIETAASVSSRLVPMPTYARQEKSVVRGTK